MARKKREDRDPTQPFNPYFGKIQDDSNMAKKPLFTWLLVLPGLGFGLWLGLGTQQLLMGLICGAVFGMATGSMLDKWREKRKKKQ